MAKPIYFVTYLNTDNERRAVRTEDVNKISKITSLLVDKGIDNESIKVKLKFDRSRNNPKESI